MFKTSGGKYIAPQVIENTMKQSVFIEQIMVIGEGKRFPAALIQPNIEAVEAWMKKEGISHSKASEWNNNDTIRTKLFDEVSKLNERFGKWEKIKEIRITPDIWSVEEGHLTPTMKLKRKKIKEKYQTLFDSIYNS